MEILAYVFIGIDVGYTLNIEDVLSHLESNVRSSKIFYKSI